MKFTDVVEINPRISLKKGINYPFVEMANVSTNSREPSLVIEEPFSSGVKFEKNDSVIARIEPCLQNGKRFFCKYIEQGFGSTEYLVFRTKDKKQLDNTFLWYFLYSDHITKSMINSMSGATGRQRVNNDIFKSLDITLPPLPTQQKIASVLSAYDDLIENNRKQIKLLEEAALKLYKEWFVKLNFPGHETTKIADGIPDGWKEGKLSDVAHIIMGQSPKSEFYNNKNEGLPFHQGVGSYGTRYVKDSTYSTVFTKIAEAGSILFSVRAPVGRLNFTKNKIVIGRGLSAMNHKQGFQSFLFYLLKAKFFKDDIIGNGSIFASISKDDLYAQEILIPEEKIAKKFNDIAEIYDSKIVSLDNQIQQLQLACDKLLPKLMNGEIEV